MEIIFLESAWRELRRRKKRTASTVFGYLVAVTILVILATIMMFSKLSSGSILSGTGTHFMFYSPISCAGSCPSGCELALFRIYDQKSLKPYDKNSEGFIADGLFTNLFTMEVLDKVRKIPQVRDAAPFLMFRLKSTVDRHLFSVGGIDVGNNIAAWNNSCSPGDIVIGRFLTTLDHGVVLLEEGYAKTRNLTISDSIWVTNSKYSVVGIVNSGIRPGKADIYMTISDAAEAVNPRLVKPLGDNFNCILVEVKNARDQKVAMNAVRNISEGVISSYNCYKPASKVLGINEGSFYLLIIIVTLFSVLIAAKTQLASVIERRRDIAILKAIGWTNQDIVMQIVTESFIMASIGGLFGCLISMAVILFVPLKQIIAPGSPVTIEPVWIIMLAGIGLSAIGGILAGIFPAFISARKKPIKVLREL